MSSDLRNSGKRSRIGRSQGQWAIGSGLHSTWRDFRDGWRNLPRGAWQHWLSTLLIGFVLTAAVVVATTLIARDRLIPRGLQSWDEQWLREIEQNELISFSNAILLESFGNLAYMIPLTLAAFVIAARAGRPLLALSFIVIYWLQRPLFVLGWMIWDRPRPQLIAEGIAAPSLHSFPSGHAALTVSTYGLLAWVWFRRSRSAAERVLILVLFVGLVTVVCWARLRLGTHWPSDILAGAGVGLLWLTTAIIALYRSEQAASPQQ